jgi:hypothetical protein
MNNDYETILEWWSNLSLEKRYELKDKFVGNVISMGQLNESHITAIYRKEINTMDNDITIEEFSQDTEDFFKESLKTIGPIIIIAVTMLVFL